MTWLRLGLVVFVIGCAAKGAVELLSYVYQLQAALPWGLRYDPLVTWSAYYLPGLLCPPSGIGPNPCHIALYEVFAVVGFGLECAVVVSLVKAAAHGWLPRGNSGVDVFDLR